MSEQDQSGIPIPEHVLDNLRNQVSGAGLEGTGEDAGRTIEYALTDEQFKMYVMVFKWLTENLDEMFQKAGGSGIGLPAENFAKLGVIAHEKELAKAFSENPGKALFYGTLSPIVIKNGSQIYRAKKKAAKKDKKEAADNG